MSTGGYPGANSTAAELCTQFRCTLIPATRVGECLACGIPFLLALWLANRLLAANSFRLDRAQYVTAFEMSSLHTTPFSYESRAPRLNALLKFLTLTPLLTGAFWSAMIWYLLRDYYALEKLPIAAAGSLAILCLVVCLGGYGFRHWQASKFRMTLTTSICFGVVVVAVLALQLAFTLYVIDTQRSAMVVFMSFNLAPVMLMAYLPRVVAPPITFQQLLRLSGREPKFEAECLELRRMLSRASLLLFGASVGALAAFGVVMSVQFSSNFGWQVSIAVLFADFACLINASGLGSDPLVLHALAFICRAVLFAAWEEHWFVAVSVNFALLVAFFIYHVVDRRHPIFSKEDALDSVVGSIESAMDETRQNESAARVAAAKAREEAARAARELEEEEERKESDAFSVRGLHQGINNALDSVVVNIQSIPGARLLSSVADELEAQTRSLFKSPEFALGILSALYVAYVAVALYADVADPEWGRELFPKLSVTDDPDAALHPQYQIGLITALLVVAATLFFLAFRLYEINNFRWNTRVGVAGVAFLVVSIGSAVGISLVAHSDIIYVFGIYTPLIAVMATLTYCNWRRQDYRWNGWVSFQQAEWRKQERARKEEAARRAEKEAVRAEKRAHLIGAQLAQADAEEAADDAAEAEAAAAAAGGAGAGNAAQSLASFGRNAIASLGKDLSNIASLNLNLLRTDYTCSHSWTTEPTQHPKFYVYFLTDLLTFQHTAADYIILFSLGLTAALHVALGLHLAVYQEEEVSYFVASVVGMVIFTFFVLLKWMNTFSVGWIQMLVLAGLLVHCSVALNTAEEQAVITSFGLGLIYPSVMCLVMAMYSWKMNNWKLSRTITSVLGCACFLALSFIVLFIVLSERYMEGALALVVFAVAVAFLGLVMVWSSNDFHLPRLYFRITVVASALIIVVALAIILALNKTWFQMVTVLWVITEVALIAYTIQETRQSDTRRLLPSLFIFPIYEYSPRLNDITIQTRNNGVVAMVLCATLAMVWGFIAALLVNPPFVGWIFFCGGGLAFLVIALEAFFKPLNEFWNNFFIVADAPSVVDHARETALASQLGADTGAFEDAADEDMEVDVAAGGDVGSATGDASSATEAESLKLLRRLQLYWSFEEASEVSHLISARRRFLANPSVPDDMDVGARAQFIAEETARYDTRIAQVFEEQTRILVMFQLLINMGAAALQKKNRARVKDFLRKYFARKVEVQRAKEAGLEIPKRRRTTVAPGPGEAGMGGMGGDEDEDDDDADDDYPLIDLASANAVEIQEWARNNHELSRRAMQYINEQQANAQNNKKVLEEQRNAAAERQKFAAAAGDAPHRGSMVIAGGAAPVAPMPPAHKAVEMKELDAGSVSVSMSVSSPSAMSPTALQPSHQGGAKKQVAVDSFQYRQRSVSFAVDELNIRGPTAESVVSQAREALASIIRRHEALHAANLGSAGANADQSLLFSDPFFPPVVDLDQLIESGTDPSDKEKLGASSSPFAGENVQNKKSKAVWKRPREIVPNPRVFASDTLDPSLIIQGDLEDCYLLSALSVIAKVPARIRNLFLVSEYNEYGIYGMCFFVDGEWRAVFVDDQFPYVPAQNKLAFARSKMRNEFWLPIVEKCYAKLYAGYPSIIGGLVHQSLKDLTGGITDEVALDSPDSGAFDGRLWQRIYTYFKEGYLMGCGNPKPHAGNFQVVSGIVQGHAYAILDLREIGDIKLIQLRNPWGEGEWEGDWGDGSDKWTQKMRTLCDYPESDTEDGIFWMAFEDFCTNFQRIYICRVFDNVIELSPSGAPLSPGSGSDSSGGGVPSKALTKAASKSTLGATSAAVSTGAGAPWCKISLSGRWAGPSAAGHVCWLKKFPARKPELNPQYSLRLLESRPSIVFLTLTQPTQTGQGAYLFLSLLVLSKNGLRAHDIKKSELVGGNTKCKNSREICAEVSLEAGKTYTIFVSTYNPGEESTFTLAAYCRHPVALQELGPDVAVS